MRRLPKTHVGSCKPCAGQEATLHQDQCRPSVGRPWWPWGWGSLGFALAWHGELGVPTGLGSQNRAGVSEQGCPPPPHPMQGGPDLHWDPSPHCIHPHQVPQALLRVGEKPESCQVGKQSSGWGGLQIKCTSRLEKPSREKAAVPHVNPAVAPPGRLHQPLSPFQHT